MQTKTNILFLFLISLLVVTIFSVYLIGGEISKSQISLGTIKLTHLGGEWKTIHTTDLDFFPYIQDKNNQKTQICLLSKTATKTSYLEDKDFFKSANKLGDKNSQPKIKAEKIKLEKDYYGYCYTTDKEKYVKIGDKSTVLIFGNNQQFSYNPSWANITIYIEKLVGDNWTSLDNASYEEINGTLKLKAYDQYCESGYCQYRWRVLSDVEIKSNGYNPYVSRNIESIFNYFGDEKKEERHVFDFSQDCLRQDLDANCSFEYLNNGYEMINTFYSNGSIDPVISITTANVFATNNIYNNISVEGTTLSHLDLIGDTSNPWRGFNYTVRTIYPPYFAGDDNNSYAFFDGSTGWIKYGSMAISSTMNATYSFWINPRSINGQQEILMDNNEFMGITSGYVYFRNPSYNNYIRSSSAIIIANNWYHIVITTTNTTNTPILYVNGINISTTNTAVAYSSYTYEGIGSDSGLYYFFNGSIDNVLVLNRSLNSTEVSTLYNLTRKDSSYTDSNLISTWRFDNTNFTNAYDSKGTNNGTFINGANYGYDSLGLYSYYPFDVNTPTYTYDYSNNHNDAQQYNGILFNLTCNLGYGNCYSYDGINDNLYFGNRFNIGTGDMSFSVWAKFNQVGVYQSIFSKSLYGGAINRYAFLTDTNGYIKFFIIDNTNTEYDAQTSYTPDTNWHHYIVIINRTKNMTIYKDGIQITGGTTNISAFSNQNIVSNYVFEVGAYNDANGNDGTNLPFNGSIDELMIFNTALNSSQITDIYNNQSQRFKIQGTQTLKKINLTSNGYNQINLNASYNRFFNSNISARLGQWDNSLGYNNSDLNSSSNGLVAYWHFDENNWNATVGVVKDSMGKYNSTTIYGVPNTTSSGVYYKRGVFNSSSGDIIYFTNPAGLNLTNATGGTVSMWVYLNPKTSNSHLLLGHGNSANAKDSYAIYHTTTAGFGIEICNIYTSCVDAITSVNAQGDGTWHYVVAMWNSTNVSIYDNAVRKQTVPNSVNGPTGNNTFRDMGIGDYPEWYNHGYGTNGSIDEVMIFNRTLTQAEITELYIKGRALWNYTSYQNLSSINSFDNSSINIFNISTSTTDILPDFLFLPGNSSSNLFYTPNIINSLSLDTMAPTYSGIPLNNSNFNISNVNFTLNLTDNSGLKNASLTIYNSTGIVNQTNYTYSAGTLTSTISIVVNLINNIYTWFLDFWDVNGNRVTSNNTLIVDTIYPNITISSPSQTTYNDLINITTSDNIQQSSFIDLDKSLLLYFSFEKTNASGDPTDYSTYSNNGSLINSKITTVGSYGDGASFNGVTDKIVVSNTGKINISNSSTYTWSFWANYDTTICAAGTTTSCVFLSQNNGSTIAGRGYYTMVYGNSMYMSDGTAYNQIITTIPSNQWNYYTIIYNKTNFIGYLNGVRKSTVSASFMKWNYTGDFILGNRSFVDNTGYGSRYIGNLDEVMIFNRTLSELEINASYNSSAYQLADYFNLIQGNHSLTAYTIDKGGNINSSSINFTKYIQVNISSPVNGTYYNISNPLFNISSSEERFGSIIPNLDSSLVSWYRMDDLNSSGGIVDYIGRNNLTNYNTTQIDNGQFGHGMFFNGTNSYAVNKNGAIGIGPQVTWSAWINSKTTSGVIFGNAYWTQNTIYLSSGKITALPRNSSNFVTLQYSSAISLNTWYYVVMTYDNSTSNATLYVNGLPVSSVSLVNGLAGGYGWTLGCDQFGNDVYQSFFNGSLDDVLVFNRTLNSSEIMGIYNATRISYSGINLSDGSHNLIAYTQDTVGNINSSNINFTVDTNNPNATLLTPSNNSINSTNQNFTVNLTDNLGIKNATIYIHNSTGTQIFNQTFTFVSGTLQQVIGIVVNLADGAYNWFVKMFDWSGNSYITSNFTFTKYSNLSSEGNLSEWRMFQRWLNHTSWDGVTYSTINGLNNANYTGMSYMEGSPTVANGLVYIGDTAGTFYQFNATNISQQINNISLINPIYSSAMVLNNYAYIGTLGGGYGGTFYQLNSTNISKQVANFSYGLCSLYSNPAIANGFLYVPLTCTLMYQLNASNVSQLINTFSGGSSLSSVAIAGDYAYVGEIGNFYQLNATNISKIINTFNNGGYMADTEFSSPLVYSNSVFINDFSGVVYQLNASNISKSIANFTADGPIYGSPAIANGFLYFKTSTYYYQLNASNISQQIATYGPVGGDVKCSPTITNEYAYFGGGNHKGINQLNASNISQLINNYIFDGYTDSTPAIANGYLYVGTADSSVLYQLNAANVTLENNFGACSGSGNCLIDCSTNPVLSNTVIPANISFIGTGKVTINGNLTYTGTKQYKFQYKGCNITGIGY